MATPPEEVLAPPRSGEAYISWRATTDLRAPYRIAPEFLRGTKRDADWDTDETPLIVFINARSGGRVGPELASVLARALGRSQVFDLSQHRPDTVLARIWANLVHQEAAGNARAGLVRSRLRILACGGDGTVAWIMKVIRQLDLQPQPPVAILPLGTGNDLSRSFRWGAEFVHGWIKGPGSVYSTLKRIADAPVADLDCWRLRLLLPSSSYKPAKTYAMCEVQQQQQRQEQQQQQQGGGCAGEAGDVLMEGFFWNYFSVGADAQAAYAFHHLRDAHPHLAGSRLANQFWYSTFSCTSGWFCGAIPSVSNFTHVEVLRPGASAWSVLHVPPSIKALVLVNLQSYAGGRNIWGSKPSKVAGKWAQPGVADGLLEVVGFHSGYHALAVMSTGAKLAHGKRLAQVCGIRLALRDAVGRPDGEAGHVFMQLDGEPWLQQVPAGGGDSAPRVVLEVVNWGTSKVLANSSKPEKHPEKHITKMLTEQQQAAYLAASKGSNTGSAAAGVTAAAATKQQQELQAVHIAAQPAAGRSMLEKRELPAGAGTAAAARPDKQAAPAPPHAAAGAGAAAAAARVVATDGGAPCSTQQEHAGVTLDARRSLEHDAAGGTSSAASDASAAPSSSGSGVFAPLTPAAAACLPGAVALIEAVGSSSGRAGSAQPGGSSSGSPVKQPGKGAASAAAAAAAAAAAPPRAAKAPAGFSFWGSGKPKAQASAAGEPAGEPASQ